MSNLVHKWHNKITEISYEEWQGLVGSQNIPFFKLAWLKSLESSESICINTGWLPIHLSLWRDSKLIAFAPLYLKSHSYGEFIFDQGFARLAQDLGLRYYPKIIGMSPFSPVEGYRFYISSEENNEELNIEMMKLIDLFAKENKILSSNFLYVDKQWQEHGENANYCSWVNKQSLWERNNIKNFDDYLSTFRSNQKRNIKRERKSIIDAGIKISVLNGEDISIDMIRKMYFFYEGHCAKWGVWGSKYLSEDFFNQIISSQIKDNIVLFIAHKENLKNPIAMSFCLTDWEMLWGRYWGSDANIDNLHFEICYYAPIAWAIKKGLKSFDPGAGGSHKIRRGFLSQPRISLHKWYDKRMEALLKEWLKKTNQIMYKEINASNNEAPLKQEK